MPELTLRQIFCVQIKSGLCVSSRAIKGIVSLFLLKLKMEFTIPGIGNDPRENQKFNMVKQGLDYDPDGEYIRTWVPELKGVYMIRRGEIGETDGNTKEEDTRERRKEENKAGYTVTLAACRWAGAVLGKVTRVSGQELYAQKAQTPKK